MRRLGLAVLAVALAWVAAVLGGMGALDSRGDWLAGLDMHGGGWS